ncbi:MAG: hypothetical protein RLZZ129_1050 [Verrucomicrobiota bacterium]
MKKFLFPILLLLAFVLPAGLAAKDFEGTIQMTMTDGRNKAMPLAYSIKGHQIRTDIQTGGTNATAILDFKKMEMIMLMPGQPMYMVMPLEQAAEAVSGHKPDDVKLEKTGVTETIIGYACTKYLATSKDGVTEIWATEELGSFRGLGGGMGGGMGKAAPTPGWERAIAGQNFFPLRVTTTAKNKQTFRMEATAVERKALPDSFFAPPAGYKKFDMGGLMQGLQGLPGMNR